ncbi:MAG: HDOD domain-containing protein [Deltaproteobacteria bacterium]|nr:MAG: HDOD domain-containing protein [Deltaproteobacteria bacterium]
MKAGAAGVKGKNGFAPLQAELVRSMVGRIQDILPLPNMVNAILKVVNDPYASLSRVSETILKDQALTAKVLKLINSAYYGLPAAVGTVTQAVSLLGLDKIKNLAMAISLAEGLYRYSGLPFGRGALWHHSQACGVATSLVASAAGYPSPEEALIAGLIHDIAKALWTELFPERFLAAIKAVQLEGRDPLDAEKEFLTVPHAAVGAWMLEKWQLPEVFQQAVALHHEPQLARVDPSLRLLSRSLYVGNQMAKLLNLGEGGNYRLGPLPREALEDLHLSREELAAQVRALPKAFFDFVEELKLEGAQNSRLNTLADRLHDREAVLLAPDRDLGPGALFFEAFAARTRIYPLKEWPPAEMDNETLFFWEGDDPQEALGRWRVRGTQGRARLLLFRHRSGVQPERLDLGPDVHLWGPEWRLEDFLKGLPPVGN